MNTSTIRTLAAAALILLLGACGGEQSIPLESAAPLAMAPAPYSVPVPSHAGLQGSACTEPACQQGPADLADEYRSAAMERNAQDAAADMPSYPHVPQSAMVIAEAHPAEVLGTAARVIVR
jgi:hypothetical protein